MVFDICLSIKSRDGLQKWANFYKMCLFEEKMGHKNTNSCVSNFRSGRDVQTLLFNSCTLIYIVDLKYVYILYT